jgi:6-phosphofructokinase
MPGAQLTYRNQGGFNMIGSGRDKIESAADLERAAAAVSDLRLDGLVVAGGDDSNTNAAVLAEYFLAHGARARTLTLTAGLAWLRAQRRRCCCCCGRPCLPECPVPGRSASVQAPPGRPNAPGAWVVSLLCCTGEASEAAQPTAVAALAGDLAMWSYHGRACECQNPCGLVQTRASHQH